jgi:hypothetical protein
MIKEIICAFKLDEIKVLKIKYEEDMNDPKEDSVSFLTLNLRNSCPYPKNGVRAIKLVLS